MLIFHDLSRKSEYPTVAALGFFDGVHLGHRRVLARTVEAARERGCTSAVFTFAPKSATSSAEFVFTIVTSSVPPALAT